MTAKNKKLLLGCTGSVASIKIPQLVNEIQKLDKEVLPVRDINLKLL
jgi:phosphopantothenoylcysteine synthetase/decarboxylase